MENDPYQPPHQTGSPRPRRNGCVIALAIVGVLALVAFGSCGVCMAVLYSDEEVQQAVSAVTDAFAGPGREALENAGCQSSMVMDLRRLGTLMDENAGVEDEESRRMIEEHGVLVFCMIEEDRKDAPKCSRLAKVYVDAVEDPPPEFSLFVQAAGEPEPICQGKYDGEGDYLGEPPPLEQPRGRGP